MSTNQPTYDPNEFVVYNGILLLSLDSLGAHFAWIGLDRVSPEPVQTSATICLEWLSQSPRERQKPDLIIDEMVELLRQCQPSDFSSLDLPQANQGTEPRRAVHLLCHNVAWATLHWNFRAWSRMRNGRSTDRRSVKPDSSTDRIPSIVRTG